MLGTFTYQFFTVSATFISDSNLLYEILQIPFRRELYAASSRGRYGKAFSVTGV